MGDFDKKSNGRYKIRVKKRLSFWVRIKIKLRGLWQKMSGLFNIQVRRKLKQVDAKKDDKPKRKVKRLRPKKSMLRIVTPILLIGMVLPISFLFINGAKTKDIPELEEEQLMENNTPKNITLHYGQKTYEVLITHGTLKDVIEKAGLSVSDEYEVLPDITTGIRYFDEAWVIIYEEEIFLQTIDTHYKTIEILDERKKTFERDVITAGEMGQSEMTFKRVYKNGLLYSQITLSENVIKAPEPEVVSVGKLKTE